MLRLAIALVRIATVKHVLRRYTQTFICRVFDRLKTCYNNSIQRLFIQFSACLLNSAPVYSIQRLFIQFSARLFNSVPVYSIQRLFIQFSACLFNSMPFIQFNARLFNSAPVYSCAGLTAPRKITNLAEIRNYKSKHTKNKTRTETENTIHKKQDQVAQVSFQQPCAIQSSYVRAD
jgi:hypothetical protein